MKIPIMAFLINFRKPTLYSRLFPNPTSFSSSPDSPSNLVSAAASILKHHRSKSRWSHLRSLIAAARGSRLTASEFSQIALQIRNNPHLLLRFFHFTVRHSLAAHSPTSYAAAIHILSRSRLKHHALNLIKSAMVAFSDSRRGSSLAILEALVKTYRGYDSAPFVFDLLVLACIESRKIDPALEIHSILKSKNVFLRISTLNSLIEFVSKNRSCFDAYDLYKQIFNSDDESRSSRKGIIPNSNTLNAVMIGFYREGMLDKIEEIWEDFRRFECEPNLHSFNILMSAYFDDRKPDKAMSIWEEIAKKGLNRDAVAYNTVIGELCRNGEVEKAEEIHQEMVTNGVDATRIASEHLINAYCRIGDSESAVMLYKDMIRKKFSPSSSTINAVVGLLCDKNEIDAAFEFWGSRKREARLERGSYSKMVKGLCSEGKIEEALKVQAEMVVNGFEADDDLYAAFVEGYVEEGNETMASKLRKQMVDRDRERL